MSLHASLSPETQARLKAQQRNSTITSIIISVLIVFLMALILLLMLLDPIEKFNPTIVSYQSGAKNKIPLKEQIMQRAVERKPSSPSSSMAKVIAAQTQSDIALPVPEVDVPDPSMNFGDGDDFGDGWGDGGFGGGSGGATFFKQKIEGERILYIIDYSLSMQGRRQALMRKELAESIGNLGENMKYQMIFFAGPAWVAGSHVELNKKKSAVVTFSAKSKFKWKSNGKAHDWEAEGKRQKAEWKNSTPKEIGVSMSVVAKNPLIWGTNWKNPLDMAFRMDPLPEAIIFMTDGLANGDALRLAKRISARAKRHKIVINTISLMEPKAAKAMKLLAEETGGVFALIGADGKKSAK